MIDYKTILGTIAVLMVFIGYIPYLRDSIKGKTKPHMFSWFVGMTISFIAFGLQMQDGAGPGAFVTLSAAIISAVILVLAIKNEDKDITKIDFVALLLSGGGVGVLASSKRPNNFYSFRYISRNLKFLTYSEKKLVRPILRNVV
ncbi:hypothetical protein KC952_04355 [Candidatus Saccharibacteria bacterium]|nr:hypothetical protein [Candidatus Saccharibacteria bacterium]